MLASFVGAASAAADMIAESAAGDAPVSPGATFAFFAGALDCLAGVTAAFAGVTAGNAVDETLASCMPVIEPVVAGADSSSAAADEAVSAGATAAFASGAFASLDGATTAFAVGVADTEM